jgi:hypothetical protein
MTTRLYSFAAGEQGDWTVTAQAAVIGEPLPAVRALSVLPGPVPTVDHRWVLRGITSNERYVERAEREVLVAKQQGLGRAPSTCAVLIPIRKSVAWWALTQDERRAVFETRSKHIEIGVRYLPAIARRLHHCRDLTPDEPFDFLTWFEFAPADAQAFDVLLAELRASEEWHYVDREVEIRLTRG